MEHVPGRQLSDLGKDLAPKGYELAGAAIAGLHNVPIRPDTMHFPADDLDLLHSCLEIIVAIYTDERKFRPLAAPLPSCPHRASRVSNTTAGTHDSQPQMLAVD